MRVEASSTGRKTDVRDVCGRMLIRTDNEAEAKAISALYLAFTEGLSMAVLERWAKKQYRQLSSVAPRAPAGEEGG